MSGPIELTRASRWYGQVIALNDVTTAIAPGVTGLLGPNGAGKSTFLKLAAGQAHGIVTARSLTPKRATPSERRSACSDKSAVSGRR